ncbi:MAG: hypothetical protein ACYTBZ_26925, partial [Planctomycetota bacterium]
MADIDFDLLCINCSSNLRGMQLEGVCPGCNSKIGDTINIEVIDGDRMRLRDDVYCVHCGYNLRTLEISSVCPECATAVSKSLHPDELSFANEKWLGRMRLGATLLAGTFFLSFLHMLFWIFYDRIFPAFPIKPVSICLHLIGLLIQLLVCVAVYWVTLPDPYPRKYISSNNVRWLACLCVLFSLVCSSITFILEVVGLDISTLANQYKVMILWYLVWRVVMYVGYICIDICIKR